MRCRPRTDADVCLALFARLQLTLRTCLRDPAFLLTANKDGTSRSVCGNTQTRLYSARKLHPHYAMCSRFHRGRLDSNGKSDRRQHLDQGIKTELVDLPVHEV